MSRSSADAAVPAGALSSTKKSFEFVQLQVDLGLAEQTHVGIEHVLELPARTSVKRPGGIISIIGNFEGELALFAFAFSRGHVGSSEEQAFKLALLIVFCSIIGKRGRSIRSPPERLNVWNGLLAFCRAFAHDSDQ